MRKLFDAQQLRDQLHYDPDTGAFHRKVRTSNRVKVGQLVGGLQPHGYIKIPLFGDKHYAHRLAWLYVYGAWPTNRIDHINGDRADNRIANLREATQQQNCINRPAKGVRLQPGCKRWTAQIGVNYKSVYLGAFETEEAARMAYIRAVESMHGKEWLSRKDAIYG